MFRASSAHLQEDIVVYKQHMVLSLSLRVLVAYRYAARVRIDCKGKVVGGCLKTPTNNLPPGWITKDPKHVGVFNCILKHCYNVDFNLYVLYN